jgi:hypothetical protein
VQQLGRLAGDRHGLRARDEFAGAGVELEAVEAEDPVLARHVGANLRTPAAGSGSESADDTHVDVEVSTGTNPD